MKAVENERITRIGTATPCGALMRRKGQPVARVEAFDPLLAPRMALRRAGRQPLPGPGRRDPRRDRWRCGRLWQHAHLRHQPCSCDRPWASRVPPASAAESSMLDFVAAPRQSGSRLSCPITISEDLDGIIDELPATQY